MAADFALLESRTVASDTTELEPVTPSKLCVALLLHEHVKLLNNVTQDDDDDDDDGDDDEDDLEESKPMMASISCKERKDFCLLYLNLIQGTDEPFSELANKVLANLGQQYQVSPALKANWKRQLAIYVGEGVGGIMDLVDSLRKHTDLTNRTSVCGLFLRRVLLGFDKLSFSDVSNLTHLFRQYYLEGVRTLHKLESKMKMIKDQDDFEEEEDNSFSAEVAQINKAIAEKQEEQMILSGNDDDLELIQFPKEQGMSRKQAEIYIAKQVELLQFAPVYADNCTDMESAIKKILACNPDLSEAHFLSYLNSLRLKEYCGAVSSLHQCFNNTHNNNNFSDELFDNLVLNEDMNKGFRYAALNLAALHARFGHGDEAASALREAIMMAQEANDHVCLQHALSWLYRQNNNSDRKVLMERCVAKCSELTLSYLTSLGVQSLSQYVAGNGGSPATVMDILTKSDLLNCQHSMTELITATYTEKAALWTLYGRNIMSATVSQLLLNLDTSDPSRDGRYIINEAVVTALANVARQCFDHGKFKMGEKVLELAKKLFPDQSSPNGQVWRYVQLQMEFHRAIYATDWVAAEKAVEQTSAYCTDEKEFMKITLCLCQGNASKAALLSEEMHKKVDQFSATQHVRLRILQAELACLTDSYPHAITPLMTAMKICTENNFAFFRALVGLHIAHVQLQLGMASRGLSILKACLPEIFSQGGLFECSRARMLMAKCLVASSSKQGSDFRTNVFAAIEHLKVALDGFTRLRAHHRAKDALYLMARLYHLVDSIQERNHTSAELKKLDEQYPTCATSQLATML